MSDFCTAVLTALLRRLLALLVTSERKIMAKLNEVLDLANKTNADITTKLTDKDAQIAALTAQVADLQAQLALFQGDQAVIDAIDATLTEADGKLA